MSSALLGGYKAANSVDCLIFSNENWYFGRDILYLGEGFTEVSGIIVEYVLFFTGAIFLELWQARVRYMYVFLHPRCIF
jgi:hypothetical protein